MLDKVRFTGEELSVMSFFISMTGVTPYDCIIDGENVTFVVRNEDFRTLLRNASMIKGRNRNVLRLLLEDLQKAIKKKITVIKYHDSPEQFLRSFFFLRGNEDVKIIKKPDGNQYAVIYVDPKRKGAVIGRNGNKAKKARLLAKKYFDLQTIFIR